MIAILLPFSQPPPYVRAGQVCRLICFGCMFAAIEQPSGAGEVISIVVTTLMILALGVIEVVPVMQRFRACWRRRVQLKAKDAQKKKTKDNANNTVNSDNNDADVWAPTKTRRVISSNMTELMEVSEKSGGTCKMGLGGGGGAGEDQVVMEVEMPPMLRARLVKAAITSSSGGSSSSSSSSSSTRQRYETSGKERTELGMTLDEAKRQASVNVDESGDYSGNDDNANSHDDGHVGGNLPVKEDGDDAGDNSVVVVEGLGDSYGSSAHGVENGGSDAGDGGGDAGDDGCEGPGMETAEGEWQEERVDTAECNSLFSPEGFARHQARQSGSHAVKFIGGSRLVNQNSAE